MKSAGYVDFKNKRRIVALVGRPPRRAARFDVISLRFQRGRRWNSTTDAGVYMSPDEAAWTIVVLGHALKRIMTGMRPTFARRYRT